MGDGLLFTQLRTRDWRRHPSTNHTSDGALVHTDGPETHARTHALHGGGAAKSTDHAVGVVLPFF